MGSGIRRWSVSLAAVALFLGVLPSSSTGESREVGKCEPRGRDDKCESTAILVDAEIRESRIYALGEPPVHIPRLRLLIAAGTDKRRHSTANLKVSAFDTATGVLKWTTVYDGPGHAGDTLSDVAASGDGTLVFVTGISPGADRSYEWATLAISTGTGEIKWVRRFGDGFPHQLFVFDESDMVLVKGFAGSSATFVAYDFESGKKLWTTTNDKHVGTIERHKQDLFVFQKSECENLPCPTDVELVRTAVDREGFHQVWSSITPHSYLYPAVEVGGARVFDVGVVQEDGDNTSRPAFYRTSSYTLSEGTLEWTKDRFVTSEFDPPDPVLAADPLHESVVVVASRAPARVELTAYEADTGDVKWTQLFPRGDAGRVDLTALEASSASFFATGSVNDVANEHQAITTIALDPSSGSQQWVARYKEYPEEIRYPRGVLQAREKRLQVLLTGNEDGISSGLWVGLAVYRI